MTELWCRKVGARLAIPGTPAAAVLAPCDGLSEETLSKLPEGVTLRVQASQPRNARFHRFYWALLKKISDNLPEGVNLDVEALHDVVKMGAGFTRVIKIPPDTFYELPRSIKFTELDETGFREFMDRAVPFITTKLCPGWDSETLMNEVYDFLAKGST